MKTVKAAIEAGGTKWIVAVGDDTGKILEEIKIPTTGPSELMPKVIEALHVLKKSHGVFGSLGIGTFGPIGLNPDSSSYGTYFNTPKEGWSNFNIIRPLRKALGSSIEIFLDTDVNTAVLAEYKIGIGQGHQNVCYLTVGTGIGGGVIVDGKVLKGRMHPEMGHITVHTSPLEKNTNFSACPFHQNCVEGRASGTAMAARWGKDHTKIPEEAWILEADYLAQIAQSLTAAYSPDIIILGGGVMKYKPLLSLIQEKFVDAAGDYWELPPVTEYIQVTSLHDRAGLSGALLLGT
jgi:fructokinase